MDGFFRAAAGIMAAVILWIILSNRGKEYGLLLSVGVCCIALGVALGFLEPIIQLLKQLQVLGRIQPEWLEILLKSVGIGLVAEIGTLICADAGNSAMGKTLQLLGSAAVLWLSIPLVNSLMTLLEQILGDV